MTTARYTFSIDGLFAIATDTKGRRYRVLLASGNGAHFYLSPWDDGHATKHRGAYIKEDHPQFAEIEQANRRAMDANIAAIQAKNPRYDRFAASEI